MAGPFLSQQAQAFRQEFDAVTRAGVDGDRHLAHAFFVQHANEEGEHHDRQVVYAVIPRIFEKVQGDRLAGAGKPADQNEFHEPEHNEGGGCNQPSA